MKNYGYENLEASSTALARMAEDDAAWLAIVSGKEINDDWLKQANDLAIVAALNVQLDCAGQADNARAVITAREELLGDMFGWSGTDHPLHKAFEDLRKDRPTLSPAGTVIGAIRLLHAYGVDPVKAIKTFPKVLRQNPTALAEKFTAYRLLGLDVGRIINNNPIIVGISLESLTEKIEYLDNDGFNGAQAINRFPRLASFKLETVQSNAATLHEEFGDRAARLVNSFPSLLGSKPATIRSKVGFLHDAAADCNWAGSVDELIAARPQILGLSMPRLLVHTYLLRRFGQASITERQVGALFIEPVDNHLLALSKNIKEYTRPRVAGAVKTIPKAARRNEVDAALSDGAFRQRLGRRVIASYQQYRRAQAA